MPAAQHIMQIIANETHGESYSTAKYCLDSVRVPYIEYDDAERKIEAERAETEAHRGYVDIEMRAEEIKNDEPLLKYFLDGSRHVYKVDDIAYNKKVFPVMAGQVGVGCLKRIDKRMHCAAFARKWVVALPSYSNADGIDDKSFFAGLSNTLNERLYSGGIASGVYPAGEACFEVAMYKPPVQAKGQKKVNLEDKATAVIQDCMMREEKLMVSALAGQKVLGHSAYLVKDGSLEYMSTNSKDPLDLRRIKNNYRWVIGVSKHFNPMLFTDSRGNANPKAIAQLPLFHRTPAVRFDGGDEGKDRFGGVKFAVWYLRLRETRRTQTPFDGVVKVERIIMDSEMERGVDSDEIDTISAEIINERSPTCYGADARWANHLYPVYLTELFVKSKYVSTEAFLHLF